MKFLITLSVIIFLFSSCTKEESHYGSYNDLASVRSAPNMTVTITKPDRSTVTLITPRVKLCNPSSNEFTILINYGMINQQSITAAGVNINEVNSSLSFDVNNGQPIFIGKNSCNAKVNSSGLLDLAIQSGNIITTTLSVVGEETDAI